MKKSEYADTGRGTEVRAKPENPLLNIGFNIVLPVFVLKQGHHIDGEYGPLIALFIALAIPLVYGIQDWFRRGEKNYVSVLGFVNVGFTGLLVVLQLDGIWFAVKEAFFPFILGVGVFLSGFFGKPFIRKLFWQPAILNTSEIDERVTRNGVQAELTALLRRINIWFSLSFLISSLLNFFLASRIFKPIDAALADSDRKVLLNEQVAEMTWQGYVVIALPMTVMMFIVLWYFLKELRRLTGLTTDELMVVRS